jgi:hypothetical protein
VPAPRLRSISLAAAVLTAAAAISAPAAEAAAQPVPPRFFGVVGEPELLDDGPLQRAGTTLDREFDAMVGAGVAGVRMSFFWARMQPWRSWEHVPEAVRSHLTDVDGRPYDFRDADRLVATAAARRIELLPVLLWAPYWAGRHPGHFASPPADPEDFAHFARVLVERYGPDGTFWAANPELPRVPVRDWQAWNEPTMRTFWLDQPFARRYVALLKATRRAIRRADPNARLVLGGLVYDSPGALRAIYRAGGRPHFDVVAAHPFTLRVSGVVKIVVEDRKVMRANGDARKPLVITELSWPSAKGKVKSRYGYEMTESGQAARVRAALPYLAARRHALGIERVYWYTWLTRETDDVYPFDYAGLRRLEPDRIVAKPAFAAFRSTALGLQGCRKKSGDATRCSK